MDLRAVTLIAVCVAVTIVLRFLPFVIFGRKKEIPGYITYLSGVLPYVIMGDAGGVLPEKCELFAGSHGISGDCSFRSGCRAARMEEEYTTQYCGRNCTFYMFFDSGRILG